MCCFPQNLSSAQQFNVQNIYFLHNFMYKSLLHNFMYSIYVKFLYSLSLCMCSQLCIVVIVFIVYVVRWLTVIYSQVHKYWDIDTILTFLALYTTTMDFKWNEQDVL